MKKILTLFSAAILAADLVFGGTIQIEKVQYAGPFIMQKPWIMDSVDVQDKPFAPTTWLKSPLPLTQIESGKQVAVAQLAALSATNALHLAGFTVSSQVYTNATVRLTALPHSEIYLDGELQDGQTLTLLPGTHRIVIKYFTAKPNTDSIKIALTSDQWQSISLEDRPQRFTLHHLTDRKNIVGIDISPSGLYLITAYQTVEKGGKATNLWQVSNLKTGEIKAKYQHRIEWLPHTDRYYFTKEKDKGVDFVVVDAASNQEKTLATALPKGDITLSPTEDYIVISQKIEGLKGDKDVHEIVTPDDRQPGWRNRTQLVKIDLHTGLAQNLTFGHQKLSLLDLSNNGKFALILTQRERLTRRPTTLFSLYRLDLTTMQADTLVKDDGFLAHAIFSPDAKYIAIVGSPEALGGVGMNVLQGQTPSMYDYQLYTLRIQDKQVQPLTKHFNPSISQIYWNKTDNKIYFTALDRDEVNLFCCDVNHQKIERIDQPEDVIRQTSFAKSAPTMAFIGESVSNAERIYTLSLKNKKLSLIEDANIEALKDVQLGECKGWNFVNSHGDTINGRYYLPPHFDPTKKYPLIVNYYGGCSPTSRNFNTRYPHHAYAALDYVVYVLNPSGAAGFGQAFAARHVNTAGNGVAEDIIEGTQKFVAEHSFVDNKKIGCIGASYGGFMTQYLQTKTNLFAAAISHAGISDHTSYWGEGYWGYSYSEVAMANSYPWSHQDLFVNQSPLYNAEKINTPLLFLHGTNDTNVPIGESIQMFTALKLLGKPTAFVAIEGENHHILDYNKRIKWQNTIFAWFAKWLKNDDSWWQSMYPNKSL